MVGFLHYWLRMCGMLHPKSPIHPRNQVFSCCLLLTSYSHTIMKWTGHELLYLLSIQAKYWAFVAQNYCVSLQLYYLLYCHIWCVNARIWQLLALIMACHYFSVGLMLTLGSEICEVLQVYTLSIFSGQPRSQCISSIAVCYTSFVMVFVLFWLTSPYKVGHMMMNICGLILEDPEHTVHLQTLQFGAGTNSSSQIEEVAV